MQHALSAQLQLTSETKRANMALEGQGAVLRLEARGLTLQLEHAQAAHTATLKAAADTLALEKRRSGGLEKTVEALHAALTETRRNMAALHQTRAAESGHVQHALAALQQAQHRLDDLADAHAHAQSK